MYREVQNTYLPPPWPSLLGGTADRARISKGDFVFRDGDAPRIALIQGGLVRVFIRTAEGRQVTIRYARPGDLIGLTPVLGGTRTWSAEAIVHTTLEVMTVEHVRAAAERHPELPWLIAEHIATWASDAVLTLAESISQPMATRIARHLREVAVRTPDGVVIAYISHRGLADAVGTVREVISRHLRTLRADGVVDTQPGRVTVVDEERLRSIAAGRSQLA